MANGTITIRTSHQLKNRLAALAKATERSRNWLIEEALKQYIDAQAWQIEGIKAAQKSLSQGNCHTYEDVMSDLEARINRGHRKKKLYPKKVT